MCRGAKAEKRNLLSARILGNAEEVNSIYIRHGFSLMVKNKALESP